MKSCSPSASALAKGSAPAGAGRESPLATIPQGLVDLCRARLGPELAWDTIRDFVESLDSRRVDRGRFCRLSNRRLRCPSLRCSRNCLCRRRFGGPMRCPVRDHRLLHGATAFRGSSWVDHVDRRSTVRQAHKPISLAALTRLVER
jgi:hypothetical protein